MYSRKRGLRVVLTTVAATSLVALGPGIASADEHGRLKDGVRQAQDGLQQGGDQLRQSLSSGVGTAEDSTADSSDPVEKGEARAKAEVAKVSLGGQDLVDLSRSEARIKKDDSSQSDATLLAIGGQEVLGAHAKSDGERESHAGDPFAQLCQQSGGQLCLRFLFADAYADETDTSSDALAKTGVLDACVAGTEESTNPRNDCDGQVHAGVLTSKAHTHRDKTTGATQSHSESAAGDVCAAPGDNDTCGVGAEVLKSESSSSSDGQSAGRSTIVSVEINGQKVIDLNESAEGAVPPGCTAPALACAEANQGGSDTQDGVTEQGQDAVHAGVLPDTAGGDVLLSNAETAASAGQPATSSGDQGPSGGTSTGGQAGGNGGNGGGNGGGSGVLPNTGGVWSGLLSIALAAIAGGSFLIARKRRSALV